ncbi:MAG: tetratricopeptide repeat protein [Nodularia sp. CChRGM 3473]
MEFVGRENELQNLHQLLQENNQVAIVAIAGMGGLGKTELALQYAMTQRENYKGGLCWLQAKVEDIDVQVVQFARTYLDLNPPEDFDFPAKVQYCWRNWREGNVLLVVDDVADYQQVKPHLQGASSRFRVLMTTREKLQPPIVQLDLYLLKPLAAMKLLESIVGRERLLREPLVARRLCNCLGYLPLGLELVGRYLLVDEELSLAEILQDLKKEGLKNEALDEARPEMTAKLGVAAAFELSWRSLRENSQLLGCVLSLFALAPIPWELVESISIGNEAQDWKKARRKLLQLHLLQHKGEGIYQLHPLLREFFQSKFTGLEQVEEWKRSLCGVMVAIAKDIPYTPTLEQIKNVAPVIPHIAEVANNFIEYVSDDNVIVPFIGNAWFYSGQGLYDQAFPWCEECLKVTIKRLGEEHIHVATSLYNLGGLYHSQGQCKEAEPLYQKALALRQHLHGEENLDVAQILNSLGLLYTYQSKYREAKSNYYKALIIRQHLHGEENLDVAQSFNNLGLLYASQGRYRKAKPLYQQALALRRHLLGEKHLDVAQSLNNLALLYKSQGKYCKAEPLYLEALEIQQHLLGKEHHTVATTLNNLAGLYESQEKYSKAEQLYEQALELQQSRLGNEHPNVALSLNNLASLYYSQGRYREAELRCLEALNIYERLSWVNHPNTITCRENLAYLRDRLNSQQ